MNENALRFIQDQIGYHFKNLDLLQQAFVRRSYAEENGGEHNEVLEFIGDKVLDLAVMKLLVETHSNATDFFKKINPKHFVSIRFEPEAPPKETTFICQKTEGELTELKKLLVQKNTLASRIEDLGLDGYLLMGNGDVQNNVNEENSVKEDLFEAILGAVAIDCGWDMTVLQDVVEIMLAPEIVLATRDAENYVSLIQEWSYRKTTGIPLYRFEEGGIQMTCCLPFDGISQYVSMSDKLFTHTNYHCLLKIADDLPIFRGFGQSKSEARRNVCKLAYEYLCKEGLWLSIHDEIENPNKAEAISQLEILARRGYFSVPTYDFQKEYDENGNPVWTCVCEIAEEDEYFSATASSKKAAKKSAAYEMLLYVLNE